MNQRDSLKDKKPSKKRRSVVSGQVLRSGALCVTYEVRANDVKQGTFIERRMLHQYEDHSPGVEHYASQMMLDLRLRVCKRCGVIYMEGPDETRSAT